jgi:homoserine kinase
MMRLRLPATSANLGPAFDAAALALDLYLDIEATAAEKFSIRASGRDAAACSLLEGNLIRITYEHVLEAEGKAARPLGLVMDNGIPLGMGMGSSAAARLAGVALAAHFGELQWSGERILEEACLLEGHPDNAAACWMGGFVTAVTSGSKVLAARFAPPPEWHAMVVVPSSPVPTASARAVLPQMVPRTDAVANLQRSALLTAAFAQGRADWLQEAMADRLHQPYRAELCPLLGRLLPLAGNCGVLGVALSGAGPSVLLLVESAAAASEAELCTNIHALAQDPVEQISCGLASKGAREWMKPAD